MKIAARPLAFGSLVLITAGALIVFNRSQVPAPAGRQRDDGHRTSHLSATQVTAGFTVRASDDPLAAISQALADLKEPELGLTLTELLGVWSRTDPAAALEWIAACGREDSADLRAHAIFAWAEYDPSSAANWLVGNPSSQEPLNLLALLGPWMDSDPQAAVLWTTTKIEVIQREGILADLLAICRSVSTAAELLKGVDPVVADHALVEARASLVDEQPEMAGILAGLISASEASGEIKTRMDSPTPTMIDIPALPVSEADEGSPELPEP